MVSVGYLAMSHAFDKTNLYVLLPYAVISLYNEPDLT